MKFIVLFFLYAILTLLYIPATIINLVFVSIKYRKTFGSSLYYYMKEECREIDIFAGHSFRTFFNITMLKNDKIVYKFGTHKRETISSTLGKNQLRKTLTKFGWLTVKFLDLFEENHCLKAIDSHVRRGEEYCKCG